MHQHCVFKCRTGHDISRPQVSLQQDSHLRTGLACQVQQRAGGWNDRVPGQAHPQGLRHGLHRGSCTHILAGSAARACRILIQELLVLIHLSRPHQVVGPVADLGRGLHARAQFHGAAGDMKSGAVQAQQRHQHGRRGLIAGGEGDHAVERARHHMDLCHGGNDVSRRQRVVHAVMPGRHSVADV